MVIKSGQRDRVLNKSFSCNGLTVICYVQILVQVLNSILCSIVTIFSMFVLYIFCVLGWQPDNTLINYSTNLYLKPILIALLREKLVKTSPYCLLRYTDLRCSFQCSWSMTTSGIGCCLHVFHLDHPKAWICLHLLYYLHQAEACLSNHLHSHVLILTLSLI